MLAAVVLASGCVENPSGPTGDSASRAVVAPTALPGLSTQDRLRRALGLLEDGDEATARAELVAYMRDSSNSYTGRSLLRQIDTPPAEYFPAEYREVILRKGQSLSNIAKDYLGSAVKFHALAKYNAIERPKRMFPGQIVKVPLTDAAQAAFANLEDALDEPAVDSLPLAERFVTEPTFQDGEQDSAQGVDGDTPAISSQSMALKDPMSSGESSAARSGIAGSAPENSSSEEPAGEARAPGEPLEVRQIDVALDPAAEEVSPAQEPRLQAAVQTAPVLTQPAASIDVDGLHRQAINAYRAQDLDTAILLWNQILAADPSYEGARLYRSQALALKKRLNSLN